MNALEKKIALSFKVKNALFTGSGTTALYLSFLYLKRLGKNKILIPSMVCPQITCAAIKAGCEVIFCDVNLKNYTLDFKSLIEIYKKQKIDCIVLVHIYGHFCDEKIIDFAKKHNIFLLEDCAQTYKVNKKCDLSILSFGHTKFLENRQWGGV